MHSIKNPNKFHFCKIMANLSDFYLANRNINYLKQKSFFKCTDTLHLVTILKIFLDS